MNCEYLHPGIALFGYVDASRGRHRYPYGCIELAAEDALGSPLGQEFPSYTEYLHPVN